MLYRFFANSRRDERHISLAFPSNHGFSQEAPIYRDVHLIAFVNFAAKFNSGFARQLLGPNLCRDNLNDDNFLGEPLNRRPDSDKKFYFRELGLAPRWRIRKFRRCNKAGKPTGIGREISGY